MRDVKEWAAAPRWDEPGPDEFFSTLPDDNAEYADEDDWSPGYKYTSPTLSRRMNLLLGHRYVRWDHGCGIFDETIETIYRRLSSATSEPPHYRGGAAVVIDRLTGKQWSRGSNYGWSTSDRPWEPAPWYRRLFRWLWEVE